MKYEQQIDRFLLGQMSSEEASLFIQECKQNSELKEEATMMALLVKTIKQTHNMKEKNYHVIANFKVHKFEWYSEALQFALNNNGKLYVKEFSVKYEN